MKIIRFLFRFLVAVVIALLLVCGILWISGNSHLIKAVRSTYLVGETGPTIADYAKFKNNAVLSTHPQPWAFSKNFNHYKLTEKEEKQFNRWESVAFLVVQNDSIQFEKYWDGYSNTSLSNSFSMAKSFTALAIGAAIKEGKIKSLQQKVGDFLPEFSKGEKAKIDIQDLLQMSSGLDFGESYNDPFGFMAKTYYGNDLYNLTVDKKVEYAPHTVWKYQGGNTLLLSFILEKATGKGLSAYFSEHFWNKIGASQDALWSISKGENKERAYCCFYSNAEDYARIGQLMLDSGKWNNQALISNNFFEKTIQPVNIKNDAGLTIDYYGLHWWLGKYKDISFYYARGIQGQYIVCIPAWNAVMVRLGNKRDPKKGVPMPEDLLEYMAITENILN